MLWHCFACRLTLSMPDGSSSPPRHCRHATHPGVPVDRLASARASTRRVPNSARHLTLIRNCARCADPCPFGDIPWR